MKVHDKHILSVRYMSKYPIHKLCHKYSTTFNTEGFDKFQLSNLHVREDKIVTTGEVSQKSTNEKFAIVTILLILQINSKTFYVPPSVVNKN